MEKIFKKHKKYLIAFLTVLIGVVIFGYFINKGYDKFLNYYFRAQDLPENVEKGVNVTGPVTSDIKEEIEVRPDIEIVVEDLEIPWDVAFLPDGDILVTERPGRLLRIDKKVEKHQIEGLSSYTHYGEGGLLGMTLHPKFKENKWIYLYFTTKTEGDVFINRVSRFEFENDKLSNEVVIVDNIPGAKYHDGGRMEFGPDGMLYITTGDASKPDQAQSIFSLGGKVLRVRDDGWPPSDNPYAHLGAGRVPNANAIFVWSYGHRNSQGLAWDAKGNLWSTEHGRSGALSGLDELNLIERGKNYGWPEIQGDEKKAGMEPPVLHSGPDYTWAPASAQYYDGSVFFGGLRGSALYEAVLDGTKIKELKVHFLNEFGRIRTVRLGPDGYFYITTSNRDGRGTVRDGDDKIIRINPKVFR